MFNCIQKLGVAVLVLWLWALAGHAAVPDLQLSDVQVPSFDMPVTYNGQVQKWIHYFQTRRRGWFKSRLERSRRYLPLFTYYLRQHKLPEDLAYMALIESGFSPHATSRASAVGYWQFIKPTAFEYGLKINWWLDERRDYRKSTLAAARYLSKLYRMFNSWYLSAAAYNMGENKLRRLILKHKTHNFWQLSQKSDFPLETKNHIPKMLAALFIAKAPKAYGFRELKAQSPYSYDYVDVPGGTDLLNIADRLGLNRKKFTRLNPELVHSLVPREVQSHMVRVPKGYRAKVRRLVY